MKRRGYSLRDIARTLHRSVSTIADELRRNRVKGKYDSQKAQHKAYVRRKYAKYQGMKIVRHPALRDEVENRLYDDQSPEAIARRVSRREKHLPSISKNAIYRYIKSPYGRRIETHRWTKKRPAKKRASAKGRLKDRTFIDKRPLYINRRQRVGDAEADFIVSGKSGKGILLVVADRKTRITFIEQIIEAIILNMEKAFVKIKKRFPELQTITTDNDLLFAHHKRLETILEVRIYFCHAYHSWEKGTVENANGVIRRDIPKGSDISKYAKSFIQKLEEKLNRRPMKILQDYTPQEVLEKHRKRIQRNKKHRFLRCSD